MGVAVWLSTADICVEAVRDVCFCSAFAYDSFRMLF